jgi:hypothetical protein
MMGATSKEGSEARQATLGATVQEEPGVLSGPKKRIIVSSDSRTPQGYRPSPRTSTTSNGDGRIALRTQSN